MAASISVRKSQHLDLCLSRDVSSQSRGHWDAIRLPHNAAPEIDFSEVSLQTSFLNLQLKAPWIISSMTGGSPAGEKLNLQLAQWAEKHGILMGVGSQRILLENRKKKIFQIRKTAPKAFLFANIGLVQLNYGVSVDDCQWLVDHLEAQGLILHLNPLQEAIQKEGNRNFHSLLRRISELKETLRVPLILKETGCGLDAPTIKRAIDVGIDAIDIAGLGGTHWGYIEGLRNPDRRELGQWFRDWGLKTPEALLAARSLCQKHRIPLIASGGIQNGLEAAKAFYLGADIAGMGMSFLKAAQTPKKFEKFLELNNEAIKIALFCTGQKSLGEFKKVYGQPSTI